MSANQRSVRIEWGDCDPAGIVYYPRYLEMFDNSTVALFERATGLKKAAMSGAHSFAGFPMVDVHVRFLIPSQYGDDVVIESEIAEFRRSSFTVRHRLTRGDELAVECTETRVWTEPDASRPGGLKSAPIPQSVKDAFRAHNLVNA